MNKRDIIKSLIIALFNNGERRIAFAEGKYIYEVNINRIEKTDGLRGKEFTSVIIDESAYNYDLINDIKTRIK